MKSEKAEAIIKNNEWMDDETQTRAIYSEHAVYAAELSELEAEERHALEEEMLKKWIIDQLEITKGAMILDGYEPEDSCIKYMEELIQKLKPDKKMLMTVNERWIINHLIGKDYTSPTEIGFAHAFAFGYTQSHHSSWASPICLKLVKKGILLRNEKGYYKLDEKWGFKRKD